MSNAFTKDLSTHLSQRIDQALDDYADRCETVDIDRERATTAAMTVLGFHLCGVAMSTGATEDQFIEMCRWHFRNLQSKCCQQEAV